MKIPSIDYLREKAIQSFLRFPLSILSSALAVSIGIFLIENGDDLENIFPYLNALLCLALGIPLFFLSSVFGETKMLSARKIWLVHLVGVMILILIYFSLPGKETSSNTSLPYIRYALYNAIIHLAVSFFPYLKQGRLNGFWQYNKSLFLRFLAAIIYSGVLYAGLCIALLSLKLLFDVDIPDRLWFELFVLIIGLFNTWFFVAGVPEDFDQLENTQQYPRGLKFFTQYILLPLLILYLVILYAYLIKIVVGWTWPEGIVSYLILFVSVLGIFAILLIHPYRNQAENSWISKFSTVYYYTLIPLIVVLFFAIYMRINDYGITINRYAIFVLGIWLSFTSIYFVLGKRNIKIIPMSLAVMMLVVSFGPWGVFSVSERSQVDRLQKILKENQILVEGKIVNEAIWAYDQEQEVFKSDNLNGNSEKLSDSLYHEVSSILNYLDDHHGFNALNNWTNQNIDSLLENTYRSTERWSYYSEASIYLQTFGLENFRTYYLDQPQKDQMSNFSTESRDGYLISSYDYFIPIGHNYFVDANSIDTVELDSLRITIDYPDDIYDDLNLNMKDDTLRFPLGELANRLNQKYDYTSHANVPVEDFELDAEGDHYQAKILISRLQTSDSTEFSNFYGKLLLRKP